MVLKKLKNKKKKKIQKERRSYEFKKKQKNNDLMRTKKPLPKCKKASLLLSESTDIESDLMNKK